MNTAMAKNCSGCKEKRPAHSLCTNCNKWLCSLCTEAHGHSKETGEHFLAIPLKGCSGAEKGEMGEYALFCPMHSQETLKLFCETCDVLICRCCLLTEHKEHRFRHLQEALQNQRAILENVTAKVEEKKNGVQVSAKQIEDRLFEVKHLQRKVENQVKMAKMFLISEINKRANVLLEQLERISSERRQKLEQQLQDIMVLNRQFDQVQNFLSWAVCSKNSVPFLFSKELIVFQIQRLLETNCNADLGPSWKVRFTWDPSFWTKQLSNLGHFSMDGGPIHHLEIPPCGNMQGTQPSLYHPHRGHNSSAQHNDPLNNQSHQFQLPVHCPTPVCCTHCLNVPHTNKGQLSPQALNHPLSFQQPSEVQPSPQPHFPLQYNMQHREREQRCSLQHLKTMEPCAQQRSHQEHDGFSARTGKYFQEQPGHLGAHPIYPPLLQDGQQGSVHCSQPSPEQSAVPSPAVQGQLSPFQKLKLNSLQKHSSPPLSPQPSPTTASPKEKAHGQVIQQSLDIMHRQFELEEMKKDLELLLQAQQPSLQLNQAKPPQHVQQTIVGQINYIVRQPAVVHHQSQEENQQIGEDSVEAEGQKTALPFDRTPIVPMSQPLEEAISSIHSPENVLDPIRKRSASLNIGGFSNAVGMDLHSIRVSKSADLQAKGVAGETSEQSQSRPETTDVSPGEVPAYSLTLERTTNGRSPDLIDPVTTSSLPLVSTTCKLESEEFGSTSYLLRSDSTGTEPRGMNELPLPTHNILEEPINLSVKKTQPCASSPIRISNTSSMQSVSPKQRQTKDYHSCEKEHIEMDIKCNQSNRAHAKEVKTPYVRLERLKICTSESGELPVFKLQPQKNQHDGTFLLIIECGTQSSSMSIKVNQGNLPERVNLNSNSKNLDERKSPMSHVTEQASLPLAEQRLANSAKKSVFGQKEKQPVENEDFCAVCLNGGELLCCDYCPKVFHLSCHVPALLSFPVGEWVCTLCHNVEKPEVDYDCENIRFSYSNKLMPGKALYGLDDCDQKKCEKLVLSLLCNNLSLPFHEPVSPLARHYYQIIKKPMDLSTIRKKLLKKTKLHYSTAEELVADVRLMFWNCATFNYPDSEVAEAGRCLEIFFESKLKDIYPGKQFCSLVKQDDSDSEEVEDENSKVAPKGFQWPSYRPECIQPKRRRRHADTERTKRPMFWQAKGLSQV